MRRLLRLINEVSLGWLVAALGGVIFGFGLIYWLLASAGAGLEFTFGAHRAVNLADSLYFSLVTISSLGYGDIHPLGISRLFVGLEVIMGFAFFGVLVAKISSAKQDYILKRLYSEKVEAEVKRFGTDLEEGRELYRITSGLLLAGEIDPEQTTTFQGSVPEVTLFYRLLKLGESMRDMMTFEARNDALFGDVSDSAIGQLYSGWQDVLAYTLELFETDAERSCHLVFCGNSAQIAALLAPVRDMSRLGLRESRDKAIRAQCASLTKLADRVEAEVLPGVISRESSCDLPAQPGRPTA